MPATFGLDRVLLAVLGSVSFTSVSLARLSVTMTDQQGGMAEGTSVLG